MKHVLIYAPQACGKSLNSAFLANQFGCESVEDGVRFDDFKDLAVRASVKTLFITDQVPDVNDVAAARRADVLSFGEAMRRAGVAPYGEWISGHSTPDIAAGTELAVRMRGRVDGRGAFVEVNGFYLNEYGLYYDDGCECFADGKNPTEQERHDNHGCPHSGFYYFDPLEGEEAAYKWFEVAAWCKR
ncbi:MAG TPA: hypothetical protein VL147_18645 [Devosia sp.]|nr:hypothetical protein [Devosia sp.]